MLQVSFHFPSFSLLLSSPGMPVILSTTHIPKNPRCINTDRMWNPSERKSPQKKSHGVWIAHGLSKVKHPQVKYWAGRKACDSTAQLPLLPGDLAPPLPHYPEHFHAAGDCELEGIVWKIGHCYIKSLPEQLAAPVQSVVAPHLLQFYYYSLNSPKMLGFSFPVSYQLLTGTQSFSLLLPV